MQKKRKPSKLVEVQILDKLGQVQRTVKRTPESAERFKKFKESYRVVEPIEPPKKKSVFEKKELELSQQKPKTEKPDNKEENKLIALVNKVKDIKGLEPYIDHEMVSVRNAAEKRFNELSK